MTKKLSLGTEKVALLAGVLACVVGGWSVQAAIISQDAFLTGGSDYAASGLNTQNVTATGFSGAYTADTNFSVTGTGLTFAGGTSTLTTSGGGVAFGPTTSAAVNASRSATAPATTNPLYVSFLVRSEANSQTASQAALLLGGIRVAGMLNGNVFGYSGGTETQGSAFTTNSTYLFVLKITPNGGGTTEYLDTWYFNTSSAQDLSLVDPAMGANSSTQGKFTSQTGGPNFLVTGPPVAWQSSGTIGFQARGQASGWTTGNLIMDELKVGGSWGDVVAVVPEPSTWCLLVGGLIVVGVMGSRQLC